MTASFSATGEVPMSAAIAGSEVAMTVESSCSMNSATARTSGTSRGAGGGAAGAQAARSQVGWKRPAGEQGEDLAARSR